MGTGGESLHHKPRKMKTTQSLISKSEALISKMSSILADLDNCIDKYNFQIERRVTLIKEINNMVSELEN